MSDKHDINRAEISSVYASMSFEDFKAFMIKSNFDGDFEAAYKKIGGVIKEKKKKETESE